MIISVCVIFEKCEHIWTPNSSDNFEVSTGQVEDWIVGMFAPVIWYTYGTVTDTMGLDWDWIGIGNGNEIPFHVDNWSDGIRWSWHQGKHKQQ
jgi:hypothetical protein